MNTELTVRNIIAPLIELNADEITPEGSLPDEYGVNSLLGIEILVALEKAFKVKIPESMMQEMTSVRKIASMIDQYQSEQQVQAQT